MRNLHFFDFDQTDNVSRLNPGSAANCLRCIETIFDRSQTTCSLILFHTGIKAIKVQHKCHKKKCQIFLLRRFFFSFYSCDSIIIVEIYFVFSSLFLRIFLRIFNIIIFFLFLFLFFSLLVFLKSYLMLKST